MNLENRMAVLERKLVWHRRIFALIVMAAVLLAIYGAAKPIPDLLQVRKLEVVSAKGNTVVILGTAGDHGFLEVSSNEGIPVFDVIAHPRIASEGIVSIRNIHGKEIVNVRAGKAGEGVVSLRDAEGFDKVILRGSNDASTGGEIVVLNALRQAHGVAGLHVDAAGHGEIRACPSSGKRCRLLIPSQ